MERRWYPKLDISSNYLLSWFKIRIMENVSQKVLLLIWICSLIIAILDMTYDIWWGLYMIYSITFGLTFVPWCRGLKKKGSS